jgi:hypothetical protein
MTKSEVRMTNSEFPLRILGLHMLSLHLAGFTVGGSCAVVGFLQSAMRFGHASVSLRKGLTTLFGAGHKGRCYSSLFLEYHASHDAGRRRYAQKGRPDGGPLFDHRECQPNLPAITGH